MAKLLKALAALPEPVFESLYPHGALQPSETNAIFWLLQVPGRDVVNKHIHRPNTHIYKIIKINSE